MERELDKEFEGFEDTKSLSPASASVTADAALVAAEAPATRVPKAAAALEELKMENNIFHRSFVEVVEESATNLKAAEAARTRVPAL